MNAFILIVIMYHTGATIPVTVNADFNSKEACVNAASQLSKSERLNVVYSGCFAK